MIYCMRVKFSDHWRPLILTFQALLDHPLFNQLFYKINYFNVRHKIFLPFFAQFLVKHMTSQGAQRSSHFVLLNTQHKYLCMQTYSEPINSICPPSSPISLIPTDTHAHKVFSNLHAPIWEKHTSEKEEGWIRLLGITVAWKAHR